MLLNFDKTSSTNESNRTGRLHVQLTVKDKWKNKTHKDECVKIIDIKNWIDTVWTNIHTLKDIITLIMHIIE